MQRFRFRRTSDPKVTKTPAAVLALPHQSMGIEDDFNAHFLFYTSQVARNHQHNREERSPPDVREVTSCYAGDDLPHLERYLPFSREVISRLSRNGLRHFCKALRFHFLEMK